MSRPARQDGEARSGSGDSGDRAALGDLAFAAAGNEPSLAERLARSLILDRGRERLEALRGETIVVKYGGAVMGEEALAASWAGDLRVLLEGDVRAVVVHGGGPTLTRTMARLGIASEFVDGHRVTTAEIAELAEMVLSGRVNKQVVSLLGRAGLRAVGLSGSDAGMLRVRPYRPGGRDLGFVGEVESVETSLLDDLLGRGYTPVISSTTSDRSGQTYNINADLVASAVAVALGAMRVVFLSDVPGLVIGGRTVPRALPADARGWLEGGEASGGMLPKLEGAIAACEAGIEEVHVVDGRERHALLRSLLLESGPGTVLIGAGRQPEQSAAERPSRDRARMRPPEAARIGSSALARESSALAWAGTLAARGASCLIDAYARYPIEIATGRGCRVTDSAGRVYLDFAAGIAVNVLGHGHPAILAALGEAAEGPLHTSNLYWTEPMVALAEKLTRAAGMEKAFFCNSGAEAVEAAIKLARKARPRRSKIVVFERSFHGRTMGALSGTMQARYQDPFRPLLPGFHEVPFDDIEAAARAIDEDTAAVLIEPVQGEGGVRPAPAGALSLLRRACDRAGALLLLDEVQTGIGRTGTLFAFQAEGVLPDAVAVAKALAGGLPMGALLARGEAARAIVPGDHGSTFGGGPFVATVASAVLDTVLSPGFLGEVKRNGGRLGHGLEALAALHPGSVAGVRGRGLMQGLVLRSGRAADLVTDLQAHGLLATTAGKNVLRLLPPLIVSGAEIDEALAIIGGALARLAPPDGLLAGEA